jgi:hypothetical protein
VLITSDADGGSYELYSVPKDASGRSDPSPVRSHATMPVQSFAAPSHWQTDRLRLQLATQYWAILGNTWHRPQP